MSALPKAVQAQLDQAEALQAQLAAESAPEQGNPEPAEAVAEQPALQLVETVQQETQVANQAPETDWEQRFKVIEGKYKAEIPRLHEANRELSERLDQAIKALETKEQPKPQESKLVTDAEFDVLSKKLVAELDKRFGAMTEQVQRTEKVVARTAEEKFWDAVTAKHPDFDAINNDPRWFEFLDARVQGSRFTRRALANDAIEARDAAALAEQVQAFKDAVMPAAKAPAKPKPNLNSQVAPNTSNASQPSPANTGRIWSGQEYAQALDHRNLQRMSRADYEALVAEAETAFAEGRVRF